MFPAPRRKTTELDPTHKDAQVKLAQLMASTPSKDLVAEAEKRVHEVYANSPADADVLSTLAAVEWRLGKLDDAEAHLNLVHDPEDATGVVIGRSCHHLLHEPVKGCDAILRFAAAKDSGSVDVQGCDVGPGTATEVLMLDMHGSARPATLRGVFSAAGLNAGFFIGGDYEFIILQRPFLPLSGVEIQYAPGLGGEVRVAREYPTAVIPGPNGVLMQPAPQRAAADGGNQTALLDLLNQVSGAPAGQRPTVLGW